MASITKKATNGLKHRSSTLIKVVQIPTNYNTPIILFTQSGAGGTSEVRLPMTAQAWARAAKGAGTLHPSLRTGLTGATRFRFSILTEEDPELGEVVTGIHCLPVTNYLGADFSRELGHPVPPEAAVVQVHEETGEVDIVAYPIAFQRQLDGFLKKIEELESIDNYTTFKVGSVEFSVMSIYSGEIMFRCIKVN